MGERNAQSSWFNEGAPTPVPFFPGEDEMTTLELSYKWSMFLREAVAAGLSPDGLTAFVATPRSVRLYSIDLNNVSASRYRAELRLDQIEDVAITNETLAVLTKPTVELYCFNLSLPNTKELDR
jgi:hypothetical protein